MIGVPVLADIQLDAPTVLLQWAVGGLFFLWITTRRREVGLGYGWLLRATYATLALGALGIGLAFDPVPVREIGSAGVFLGAMLALAVSVQRRKAGVRGQAEVVERRTARVAAMTGIDRTEQQFDRSRAEFPPALDLIAPAIGVIGLIAAGINAGDPAGLSIARAIVGAAFLGAVTDAMLLGHWYLVQPGLPRAPILELVRWTAVTTIVLVGVTRAALRERQYSAVMAATGLLYLAILMAFCMDLVARATLS